MIIEMMLSGFLFLLIIILLIVCDRFGHGVSLDLDSEAKLQRINKDPKKFRISFVLLLTENITIIALVITLYIAFNSYNIILAFVWTISRTSEGAIQIYNKKSYWGLLNIAKLYSGSKGVEKNELIESGRSILKTKNSVFKYAQILFSIGTLAYCILFITYGVVPATLGWFGIAASIPYGFGNGIMLVKPNFKALWGFGGLLILIFEFVLGGWLLFYPLI